MEGHFFIVDRRSRFVGKIRLYFSLSRRIITSEIKKGGNRKMLNEKKFVLITDSASNLTDDLLKEFDVRMLPYVITVNGEEMYCYEDGMDIDEFSKKLCSEINGGAEIKTSLINGERFRDFVECYLKNGEDVLFISLSSGVSGTYNSVKIMAEELCREYPDRKCYVIDSKAASLGEGLLVLEAARLRGEGKDIDEVKTFVEKRRSELRQVFTVDDLGFLVRGGRISRLTAVVGSLLHIKPLLKGDDGKIVSYGKVKGRKKALDALIDDFKSNSVGRKNDLIAIAHFCAGEDAEYVASGLREKCGYKGEILIRSYDICTSCYVGPGTIALFFNGENRTSKK